MPEASPGSRSARQARTEILFIVPTLCGGGAERVVLTLLRHLDRTRFKAVLTVVDMRGAMYRDDVPADVELVDLNSRRVRNAVYKIVRLIWRRRPDVVFSTLGHLNLAIAMLRRLLPSSVRYIARETIVVSHLPSAYALPRWWFWAYRTFYSRLDTVVCQSDSMRRDLIDHFGFPPEKAVVILNPLDVERVRRLADEPLETGMPARGGERTSLVAAGSLVYRKGFDLLLAAISSCRDRSFSLTILGEGPLLAELKAQAADSGIARYVRFVGFQKNPYAYFRDADALVLSSRFEGTPNVVLESLACGTPVIALPGPGGTREVLESMEGCILAEDCSAEALARVLRAFRGGTRISPDAVDAFTIANVLRRYEQLFATSAAPKRIHR